MNWEALGALGELLGSLTVVVTLVYLAVQTRSINKQSKAEARYAFVEAMGEINMVIAQTESNASVWRRGLESIDSLNSDERMQFLMYVGQFCNLWSVMHQLYDDDMLPERQWRVVCTDIASILSANGGNWFWENGGRFAFDEGFTALVSSLVGEQTVKYDMSGMADAGSAGR